MDKSWMEKRRFSVEYIEGVCSFMHFVQDHLGHDIDIHCPCKSCLNVFQEPQEVVLSHLMINGIDVGYTRWVYLGEQFNTNVNDLNMLDNDVVQEDEDEDENEDENEDEEDHLFDLLDEHEDFIRNEDSLEGDVNYRGHADYIEMLEQAQKELYPSCTNYSQLSFTVKLLHLKVYNKWSNKSFDMLLKLLKDILPEGNLVPTSYYVAKGMLRSLGLGYTPIHACKYDCVMFWNSNELLEACPICKTSRWKINDGKGKKIPWKILRYFPLKPRLRRLFMSTRTASEMRWHKEKRNDDGWLRHPADSQEWKDFDKEFPWFAEDSRNVRLGLASDGFNPFGNMSTSYSMWPVVLMPYNLPPWMCMKEHFLFLTLLIPGPTALGKDIDVYMQPLIDELRELWLDGIQTYDTHTKSAFQLHAAVLWTINDFPAYGNLSGWSTKGYLACPVCNKDTPSEKLTSEIGYLGHRRFLPINHRWRKDKKFNGKHEIRLRPSFLSGEEVVAQLAQVTERLPGKHPHIQNKRKRPILDLNWVKRSIFFTLPYWQKLKLRHNLDVMHIEKNICDNVIGTLLYITGKTKDTFKTRQYLQSMGIRKELHLVKRRDGKFDMPRACYTMTKEERKGFCQFLKEVKFPDGYASNISRCSNVVEGKLSRMKSHDCHVLLQRLLPVGIRGSTDERVVGVLAELGNFFHCLCCKAINIDALEKLDNDIIIILCKLEMIFPPAFFDVMVHLAIHLPQEARLGGPVQYRWMYPIERYLGTLKGFVRNRARPEGSIAESYLVIECLTFCSMYLDGIETQFNAPKRNYDIEIDDELSIFSSKTRPLGAPNYVQLPIEELEMMHWYVLNNCEEVQPYMEEHLNSILVADPSRKQDIHKSQFPKWFNERMTRDITINETEQTLALHSLSGSPAPCVTKYTGCVINGVRFHTKDREERRKSQNSGLIVQGNHKHDIINFYGVLVDIIQLDYVRDKVVLLFKCDWYDADKQKSRIVQDGALTSIRVDRLWYLSDSFVLATQANQVFYISDPKLGKNWWVVHQFNHRHIFSGEFENQNDVDDIEYNDDAYQDEELPNESAKVVEIGIEIEHSLRRDDVMPEVISTSIRTLQNVGEEQEQVSHLESVDEDDINLDFNTSDEESDSLHYDSD